MNNEENNLEKEKDIESETNENTVADEIQEDMEFEEVNEEGEVDARSTIKKLREKVKKLESEKKEYLDLSQRARADYMNLKKEIDQERSRGANLLPGASSRICFQSWMPMIWRRQIWRRGKR
jgi:molecular chaperone GrpE (heat shock protein)